MKRATGLGLRMVQAWFNFNPRPREEGDDTFLTKTETYTISIHALVKRATVFTMAQYNIDNISIHALVKRATYQDTHEVLFKARFQSTPS